MNSRNSIKHSTKSMFRIFDALDVFILTWVQNSTEKITAQKELARTYVLVYNNIVLN